MTILQHLTVTSPVGPLAMTASGGRLVAIRFAFDVPGVVPPDDRCAPLSTAADQLAAYFAGSLRAFDLPVGLDGGTAFQRAVWEQVRAIPYGVTRSYGELAAALGRPDRVRAVAAAVGRVPVPIVVPCHRVVGADGRLVGYGGGLWRKRTLLDLEAGRLALVA
jgi:methylated-DNA-[protein]-cysteine S-methyltransferase